MRKDTKTFIFLGAIVGALFWLYRKYKDDDKFHLLISGKMQPSEGDSETNSEGTTLTGDLEGSFSGGLPLSAGNLASSIDDAVKEGGSFTVEFGHPQQQPTKPINTVGSTPSNPAKWFQIGPKFKGFIIVESGHYLSSYAAKLGLGASQWRRILDHPDNAWLKHLASKTTQSKSGFDLRKVYGYKTGVDCLAPGYKATKYSYNTGQYPVFYWG